MIVCLLVLPAMIRRLRPLAMTVCPLMPPVTIRCLRLLATSPRLWSLRALPHSSRAPRAIPPPCWNSTQHPH